MDRREFLKVVPLVGAAVALSAPDVRGPRGPYVLSNVWATSGRSLNEADFTAFLEDFGKGSGRPKHIIYSDRWLEVMREIGR